jgi:hypothetical protein
MNEYFVALNDMQQGPFPARDLVARGMRPETLVWREGMTNWQRADSVAELAGLFSAHAPAATHVNPQPIPPPSYGHPFTPSAPHGIEYQQPYFGPRTSGSAIASLVLGILSLAPCLGWLIIPCGILAIAFGNTARGAVRRGEATGGGMALAGIICGTISLCIVATVIFMFAVIGIHAGSHFFRMFPR